MAKKKAETIKVVVVTKFKDKENGKKLRKVGEVFEVTKDRYEEIVEAGKAAKVEYIAVHEDEEGEQPDAAESEGELTDGSETDGEQSDAAESGE